MLCYNIVSQTDPDPRKSLYKLRTTWLPFLPKHKLAAIDRHVHALDPNWPVTAVDNDTATLFEVHTVVGLASFNSSFFIGPGYGPLFNKG